MEWVYNKRTRVYLVGGACRMAEGDGSPVNIALDGADFVNVDRCRVGVANGTPNTGYRRIPSGIDNDISIKPSQALLKTRTRHCRCRDHHRAELQRFVCPGKRLK